MTIHASGDSERHILEISVVRSRNHKQTAWAKQLKSAPDKGTGKIYVLDHLCADNRIEAGCAISRGQFGTNLIAGELNSGVCRFGVLNSRL
jgi:hypothetical protein